MTSLFCQEQGGHGHVERSRSPSVSAVGAPLRKRSSARRVRGDRADAATSEVGRAATDDGVARGAERDPLSAADRLSVANAARGVLVVLDDLRLFPPVLAAGDLDPDLDGADDGGARSMVPHASRTGPNRLRMLYPAATTVNDPRRRPALRHRNSLLPKIRWVQGGSSSLLFFLSYVSARPASPRSRS